MLDFSRLRSQVDGQRGAFEGLIRQLGTVNPPSGAKEFRHINGAGGDGGIEAYWVLVNGSESGFQAKFHTKPADIDWSALDGSIRAAMASHPKLIHVQIAVACDLSDHVPNRGKSAREHWEAHKARWEAEALALGRKITFALWGTSEIEQLLVVPDAVGMREYWFGDVILDSTWFRRQLDQTFAALEERYSPQDHIDVDVRRVFDGLQGNATWRDEIRGLLAAIDTASRGSIDEEFRPAFDPTRQCLSSLLARSGDVDRPTKEAFPTEEWRKLCADALTAASTLHSTISASYSKERQREVLSALGVWRHVSDAVTAMDTFLSAARHEAEAKRFAIFQGRAGAGKSHLLAAEAARAHAAGAPAVMLLGTDFSSSLPIDQQIVARLGLATEFETFLGALAAAAEVANTRALIVIDAINEGGAGARWRDDLGRIAAQVFCHERLALVVSCRTEYAKNLLADGVRARAVEAEVVGFVTADEQENAAQIYMDGRGVQRPATPWLSPEFSNPLFLRTTCLALERDGRTEYPIGLRGVRETLAFFLKATGRHLGTAYDGTDDLVGPLKRAVVELAQKMASDRKDFIERVSAARIVEAAFESFAPGDRPWLDRLRLRGILRIDPYPDDPSDDPMAALPDVVRFSFQRFQDHLVAEQLIAPQAPDPRAFARGGPLDFLLGRYGPAYDWLSVFQSCWTAASELHRVELVDCLPGGEASWWRYPQIREAFVETIYWRATTAFSERTLELFDRLSDTNDERISILLRLSVLKHPWNAELIDQKLQKLRMPDRDAFWTVPLNALARDDQEPSSADRLVNWCLGPGIHRATLQALALALVTLGWFFTSTNRQLRDRATKAATEILLVRPQLFSAFLARFASVDDPYVVERALAACVGACFRDPAPDRLREAATVIYQRIFETGEPPVHVLSRDYARSVIELANDRGVLPEGLNLTRCRPPYGAQAPRIPKESTTVKKRAEVTGASAIFDSCAGWGGDFGRYVIQGRVSEWSTVRLSGPAPKESEIGRFRDNPEVQLSAEGAKLWVARQAIGYGWTKKRFPHDPSRGDRGRGARIERIGKKYQWIALFELLARLADNFWIVDSEHEHYARAYDTPIDTFFSRNLDPTIPPWFDEASPAIVEPAPPLLTIETVPVHEQKRWVFEDSLAESRIRLSLCADIPSDDEWVALYRYASVNVQWPVKEGKRSHPTRQDEFHFLTMIAVKKGLQTSFARSTRAKNIDFHDWLPTDVVDAGYLYELGSRATWSSQRIRTVHAWPTGKFQFTELALDYQWESHLDGSLPDGASLTVPASWLLAALRAGPVRSDSLAA